MTTETGLVSSGIMGAHAVGGPMMGNASVGLRKETRPAEKSDPSKCERCENRERCKP